MNNEDKMISLLEKIYIELLETKKELSDGINNNRKSIVQLEAKIESEITDKVSGLYV